MGKDTISEWTRRALRARSAALWRALLWAASCAVFCAFALNARYASIDEFAAYGVARMTRITAASFTAVYALTLALALSLSRRLTLGQQALAAVITGAVILGKISLLDYISDDYSIFLSNWLYEYSQMGFKQGLGSYISSDYTPPYLYFLLLISRTGSFPWQYLVKAGSVAADAVLAYAVTKICALRGCGDTKKLAVFTGVTLLPTVVFNGAYWGQCDAIYVSFCLLALYCGLTRRSAGCMAFFGVALSFKLQTVFFLPALLPLWLRRDVKLRHLPLIPAAYMAMMIPALWGGKSLHHVLTVYLSQAGKYNFMTVNAPNLYQFLPLGVDPDTLYKMFSGMAMALGMAALAAACALVCGRRERVTREATLLFGVLILAGVPLFLPKMHERYTFGADVLSVALAANDRRLLALPALFGLASYVCYTEGLPGQPIMDLKWATVFQMTGVALTAAALYRALAPGESPREAEVKA